MAPLPCCVLLTSFKLVLLQVMPDMCPLWGALRLWWGLYFTSPAVWATKRGKKNIILTEQKQLNKICTSRQNVHLCQGLAVFLHKHRLIKSSFLPETVSLGTHCICTDLQTHTYGCHISCNSYNCGRNKSHNAESYKRETKKIHRASPFFMSTIKYVSWPISQFHQVLQSHTVMMLGHKFHCLQK